MMSDLPRESRGLFVTLEGVEGSGKSTQARMLHEELARRGTPALLLREPGGAPLAEAVRRLLLDGRWAPTPESELLLFLAARAQNTAECIIPALQQRKVVICDRYSDSTLAYQGHARGGDLETIRSIIGYATSGLVPDLTLLLDLDPSVGLMRQTDRNRMEMESLAFHRRVRQGYLDEAARDATRVVVLDATADVTRVHEKIVTVIEARMANRIGHVQPEGGAP
jgi:dTMP kinase